MPNCLLQKFMSICQLQNYMANCLVQNSMANCLVQNCMPNCLVHNCMPNFLVENYMANCLLQNWMPNCLFQNCMDNCLVQNCMANCLVQNCMTNCLVQNCMANCLLQNCKANCMLQNYITNCLLQNCMANWYGLVSNLSERSIQFHMLLIRHRSVLGGHALQMQRVSKFSRLWLTTCLKISDPLKHVGGIAGNRKFCNFRTSFCKLRFGGLLTLERPRQKNIWEWYPPHIFILQFTHVIRLVYE
jgi:hypothetical protein